MAQNRVADQDDGLSAQELKAKLDAGEPVVILDVREPDEVVDWHIAGSVNVPLGKLKAGEMPDLPPDATAVTVCRGGMRSEQARQLLVERGVDAVSLEGGMMAWNGVYDVAPVEHSGDADVYQVRRVGKGCLGYLVVSNGEAAAIDATVDAEAFVDAAAERGARITIALDTHAHADHVSGGRRLRDVADAKYAGPAEIGDDLVDEVVTDETTVRVGNATIRVKATPGHTPGSVTYLLGDLAFTGDTLFVESVGRPDLGQDPRQNARVLWNTLHEKLLALPASTRILPGHYSPAVTVHANVPVAGTLADLRARVPALTKPETEFVEWVAANPAAKPENFETIKRYNKGEVDLDADDLRELEAGANRCAVSG